MNPVSNPLLTALLTVFVSLPASAEVTAEEAKRLAADLTPIGGERAGNAEGTIPEWAGGITTVPHDYSPGASHPDPLDRKSVV